jgi:spermidine/putrescine transport system ATP-binding protein
MTLDAGQCMGSAAGGVTSVGFRPETLTILFEGQQATDREVMATVHEVIYFGDMTYYDVFLGGTDVEVRLSMRNVPGRPILEVGAAVQVAWSPSALVLFR